MALRIRPADVIADRALIVECLRRYLATDADEARYDWLYVANPHGTAKAWIATDEGTGETVGIASAFPRRAVLDGTEVVGWVLGDFCIHEAYRTLGPALQLNRVCLEAVDHGSAAFCYDFPSRSMMAVYRRLQVSPVGSVVRYARVLRWGRRLRRGATNPLARAAAGIVEALVDRVPPSPARPAAGLTLALQAEPCGPEFDELDRAARGRARLHLVRSAAHLNWRHRARPGRPNDILAARQEGRLTGFAVLALDGEEATIADLVARDDATAEALLHEAAAILWRRGGTVLSMPTFAAHPLVPALERAGFRPRETSPVVVHGGPALRGGLPLAERDFPLTHGDRES